MKKIKKENKRLIGIEFLTQHSQTFLPKIYGVYKEENILCIYQEYIEGGTLHNCDWNLREIRHFAETLLSAFKYMHHHDLVHGDIKLLNLMVRDPRDPSSLVVIDLESAKHPKATFYSGGHTVTYLPPWHENISQLSQYDPVLKEADLWGIACVLIFFLLPSARSDLQKQEKAGVWSKELENFQRNCQTCKQNSLICDMCKKQLLQHIKIHGKDILHLHLGNMMNYSVDDPDWKALKQVLEYLTHTGNFGKTVENALHIIKGTIGHRATRSIAQDIDIH